MLYKSGYKYILDHPETIQTKLRPSVVICTEYLILTTDGLLTLKRGYPWDGASGPTIDTKSSMRASAIHDAGYFLMRHGYIGREWRPYFDQLFHDICVEDGMWQWRAKAWTFAVSRFAAKAAAEESIRPVLVAP